MTKFLTHTEGQSSSGITIKRRAGWALDALIAAGTKGCTPIDTPAPRWAAYIFKLRKLGLSIETVRESRGGPFPGRHARYVLRSVVTREGGVE